MSRMAVLGKCPNVSMTSFRCTLRNQRHLTTEGSLSPLLARPSRDHGTAIWSAGRGSTNLVEMAATTKASASASSSVAVRITAGRRLKGSGAYTGDSGESRQDSCAAGRPHTAPEVIIFPRVNRCVVTSRNVAARRPAMPAFDFRRSRQACGQLSVRRAAPRPLDATATILPNSCS